MVLQQGPATAIFGTATPGEQVSVSLNNQTQTAVAGDDGKFLIHLKDLKAGGPFTLNIEGKNKVSLNDVYVGEVWLCSGQSNMEFTVVNTPRFRFAGVANMEEEVKNANYPTIRMFSGISQKSYEPKTTIKGTWKVVTPENVPEMSAIGYLFARDLQKEIKVPIGILTESVGGSCAEAWVSREALMAVPQFQPWLAFFDTAYKTFKETGTGRDPAQDNHQTIGLYNGMIAPILPYTVKGTLWYQGESIAKGLATFPLVNETLVKDWRARLQNPDMPFYFCQIAAQDASSNRPEVREAQAALLKVPHTAMAVTTDIGERKNVHPKNKQDVADRLTRIALALNYGRQIEYSGPVFASASVEGSAIRLKFTHTDKGLIAGRGASAGTPGSGNLNCFTIAGADGKFVPATAKIENDTVIISSPDIAAPKLPATAGATTPKTLTSTTPPDFPHRNFEPIKNSHSAHPKFPRCRAYVRPCRASYLSLSSLLIRQQPLWVLSALLFVSLTKNNLHTGKVGEIIAVVGTPTQ